MMAEDSSSIDLRGFVASYRAVLPVVACVADIDEESSTLQTHRIQRGVNLVFHGCTRQAKVLAKTVGNDSYYAIPLTYQGKFRLSPLQFLGVSSLGRAYPGKLLKVSAVNSKNFPLVVGDVFRVPRFESNGGPQSQPKELRCEKLESSTWKEVKLPFASHASFEEVLENSQSDEYMISDVMKLVADTNQDVVLSQRSPDQIHQDQDLPFGYPLILCDHLIEPAVFASLNTPGTPAFHIPLRTQMHVGFARKLDKNVSPLVTKRNPKLSTLDRCVERLKVEMFRLLRSQTPAELNSTASDQSRSASHEYGSASLPRPQKKKEVTNQVVNSASLPRPQKARVTRSLSTVRETDNPTRGARAYSDRPERTSTYHKYASGRGSPPIVVAGLEPLTTAEAGTVTRHGVEYGEAIAQLSISASSNEVDNMGDGRHYSTRADLSYTNGGIHSRQDSVEDSVFSDDVDYRLSSGSCSPTSPVSPVSPPSPGGISLDTVVPPKFAPRRSRERSLSVGTMSMGSRAPSVQSLGGASSVSHQPFMVQIPPSDPHSPAQMLRIPPGFALVPLNSGNSVHAGYGLVPVGQHRSLSHSAGGLAEEVEEDDDDSDTASSVLTLSKNPQFKVKIPANGNLYQLSTRQFTEFLRHLRINEETIQRCKTNKIDGKKFSQLQEEDLERFGLLHPIVVHFRRLTYKKRKSGSAFML